MLMGGKETPKFAGDVAATTPIKLEGIKNRKLTLEQEEQLKKDILSIKTSPYKEDLTNGNFIYLLHKENTLMEYELDLTNDLIRLHVYL